MDQSLAVWVVIVLAFGTASLPFLLRRPLLCLPWSQPGEPKRSAVLRFVESLVFFALFVGWCWLTLALVGGSLSIGAGMSSGALPLIELLVMVVLVVLLLAYPGWRNREPSATKPVIARLIELVVLYFTVGIIGFALEANMGNPFQQGWEFYAITFSLYLVLAYPGFVLRYLLRKRHVGK